VTTPSGTGTSAVTFLLIAPPTITITTPADGATLTGTSIPVGGTVSSDTEEVSVSVNGIAVQVNGGQWVVTVPLQPGSNVLTATATDATGAQASVSITVTTTTGPPPVLLLQASPDTGIAPLTVRWQVTNLTGRLLLRYELDTNGTGLFAPAVPALDGVQTTYSMPGLWHPLLRATDDQGTVYTASTTVNVEDAQTAMGRFQSLWAGL
jgi:hypothetical protein